MDMQGLSISTHVGTCCGSVSPVTDPIGGVNAKYVWVDRSDWPKACRKTEGGTDTTILSPCPSRVS